MARSTLHFPEQEMRKLESWLPPSQAGNVASGSNLARFQSPTGAATTHGRPFVTLTFATSLDSALSLAPGTQTALSGPQSKAMTHYLRSRHDAILIGVGTAVADDPSLNCRLSTASTVDKQPRPIVIDPHGRWQFTSSTKVLELARDGFGKAPFVISTIYKPPKAKCDLLESLGGKYIYLPCLSSDESAKHGGQTSYRWEDIIRILGEEGLSSIMVEGGGQVINSLLKSPSNRLVDSIIITIAPTWLGQGGVVVSPERARTGETASQPVLRLQGVAWHQLGDDVVMCGSIQR